MLKTQCALVTVIKGYQASFQVYKLPMISGQVPPISLLRCMGTRQPPSTHARHYCHLTDQDIADLSAYYGVHGLVADAGA
jgi:hypothetical protein